MTPAPILPILYTKRCRLDRITLHDVNMLSYIVEDIQFRLFMPELYELVNNVDGMYQFLSSFDTYAQNGNGFLWGIWEQSSLIGFVAIMDISNEPTIFYAMHREYRNKGYCKETVAEVVRHFNEKYPKLNLHTEVYNDNLASIRILEFCGFKVVGMKGNKILLSLLDKQEH